MKMVSTTRMGTILEVKEMIPNPDSIMEQLDAMQLYYIYIIKITEVYKAIGELKENLQIQLKTSNDCVPDKLDVGTSYLLAANTDLIIGRCNIVKPSESTSSEDVKLLQGDNICS
ncbi:uncharacterized protein LOC134710726 isoform X2 [Mytilus trossulus]|uniref:uncharacterized protein LOC134710726 isoform X2 n=1 Tax=Mytilus trossulus TaxID=6551 RepID=UPI003005BDD1